MTKWVNRWRSWIAATPSKPGVWRRKEGGFLVRARVLDPRTGKMKEVRMTLVDVDAAGAYERLQQELRRVREGETAQPRQKTRFSDYAVSLLERKVQTGEIKSAATRERWGSILRHLFDGFGDRYMDMITRNDIKTWLAQMAPRVKSRAYSPRTVNGWLKTLKIIMRAYADDHELERSPVDGIKPLDEAEYPTYTREQPNSLLVNETGEFVARMGALYPGYLAITALGFATGLRPSSLRPLRRQGPASDILWDEGMLLVRRSHSRKQEVMNTTKISVCQEIPLPQELMDILKWHTERLAEGPERASELLFPAENGGLLNKDCLNRVFHLVGRSLGLKKHITPRAMRRTFQDLARAARVTDLVTRSISGHLTEEMQHHYSTVNAAEQRESLAKVVSLAGFKKALLTAGSGVQGGVQDSSGVPEAAGLSRKNAAG